MRGPVAMVVAWTALVVALVMFVPGLLGFPNGGMWLIDWLLPLAGATAGLGLSFSRAGSPAWTGGAALLGFAVVWALPRSFPSEAVLVGAAVGAVLVVAGTAWRRGRSPGAAQAWTLFLAAGLVWLQRACVASV